MSISKWAPRAAIASVCVAVAAVAVVATGGLHRAVPSAAQGCPAGYALRDPQDLARDYNPAYA
jgi:hypothetical protein